MKSIFYEWIFIWFLRLTFCEKPLLQWSQTKGFSPVWIRKWFLRSLFCEKPFSQWSQTKGFWLVCLLIEWFPRRFDFNFSWMLGQCKDGLAALYRFWKVTLEAFSLWGIMAIRGSDLISAAYFRLLRWLVKSTSSEWASCIWLSKSDNARNPHKHSSQK